MSRGEGWGPVQRGGPGPGPGGRGMVLGPEPCTVGTPCEQNDRETQLEALPSRNFIGRR